VFILIPCIFTTLSMFCVLRRPTSFFMGASSAFWLGMVGVGYAMTGILCFRAYWLPGQPCFDNDHPSIKIGKIPAQFLLTFAYSVIVVFASFMLFGACRGRRLGRKNPEYYVHDQGAVFETCPEDEVTYFTVQENKSLIQK
jgi:hypothetical protein